MNNSRNDKIIKKLGLRIKGLRESKGITQERLAYEADVPLSQIGRIERGEVNATISTLHTLAGALKVSLRDLMDFS